MGGKSTSVRVMVIGGVIAVGVVGASIGVAGANANEKRPSYDATADSSAGVDLGAIIPEAEGVVVIGQTQSHSDTNKSGANSDASAHSLQVGGQDIGGTAECTSAGDTDKGPDGSGVQRDEDHGGPLGEPLVLGADPVTITVLSASCESRAVKSNNASSSAETSVLHADLAGTEVVVLGSKSSTKTTSGQAGSDQTEGSFTVASAGGTTLLGCRTWSQSTNEGDDGGSSFTVAGQEQPDAPCPVATSGTTYEQSNP